MNGIKTMSLASGTAKRFQSDDIIASKLTLNGIDVSATLTELKANMNQLKQENASATALVAEMKATNETLSKSYKELQAKCAELQAKYDALDVE
jgi:septal ring factor EnvC (AmiA/AmiB activator)